MKSRKKREKQELNTSSLPDIVFMILFFFMAIGMFPPPAPKIENDIVVAEAPELEDTGNYIHVRISESELQLDYDIITLEELVIKLKEIDKDVVILHIDNDTPIGYVKALEEEVLKAGKKRVAYEVILPEEV